MQILLVNHYAGGPELGMEYRPLKFAKRWVDLGHQVTIVSASHAHTRYKQPDCPSLWNEQWTNGVRLLYVKTPSYSGNSLSRIVNIASFLGQLWAARRWITEHCSPDVVISSSTYLLDIFPCHAIARDNRALLVYELHDLWPLSPMHLGKMSASHPFIRAVQTAEDFACRKSDLVISLLDGAEVHLREHGLPPNRFNHVPNGFDMEEWSTLISPLPERHATLLQELRRKSNLIVGYAGALGPANAMSRLVEATARVKDIPVAVVILGQGPEKAVLESRKREHGLTNLHFLDPIPRTSIPSFLAQVDVAYMGLASSPLYRYGISPNKLLDYMAAKLPILFSTDLSQTLVHTACCGMVAPPTADGVAEAIRSMSQLTRNIRQQVGMRGYQYAQHELEYGALAGRFVDILSAELSSRKDAMTTARHD